MAGEDFFKFNKGNEFRFSNFREIKEEDLKGADEKTKKLFNIFAGEDKILQEVEAKSLFNVLKSAAGDNQVLEDNEIKAFAKEHIGEEVDTNILATFVNNIFGVKEKPQNQAVQNVLANAPQKQQTFLEEAACKEIVIDIIDENLSEAYEILNSQYLGSISGWHDERKDKNDILKTSNVSKVLDYQNAGIEWMNKAKLAPPNGLTKKEYYEGNKQRIKDMILTRVLVLDTNTKFKELKNKYSEEKLAQIIGDYVEQLCSNASIEDLKDIQKQFVSYSGVEEIQALENVVDNAIKFNADKNKPVPYMEKPLPKFDNSKGIVPEYWNTDEPISFEEVYKIERGTEYSQYKIEQYALAKKEMEVVANAYNKKQQFIEFAEGLRKDETLNIDEKTQKVLEGFATFYALAEDGGLSQLKELIAESKLPISIDENGFNFGTLDDNAKNRALNSLLKLAQQSKEKEFEEFLNGKTIEDYQIALAQAHDEAIGDENGKMMAEAMKNDNLTCIQRWTGNTSMAGMGMTIVGGILCFTPLAPLGAGMITVGNTLAIGGMVAKTGLGVTDYATKDVQTAEEAEQLTKDFIMDAGGFIIGMGAGKAGLKAFSKLIDKKLVAVFGQQIASGNKMQALKTVFTNPEYLKNFMTAAGAKLSADFVISYAGDLAMMGILDTQDDWQSLLKANLTGILVGMSGDIKDVSGVGRPRKFGVSDGVRPMTEMDYGQRLLGNDVTVADPKTGATVEGTVTGLYSQNGQVEIEVNGQRYSTNDVAEVKGEAKVEVETPKVEIPLGQRLETASSREDFVAIRDEIKALPSPAEINPKTNSTIAKAPEFTRPRYESFEDAIRASVNKAKTDISILEIEPLSKDLTNIVDNIIARFEIGKEDSAYEGLTSEQKVLRAIGRNITMKEAVEDFRADLKRLSETPKLLELLENKELVKDLRDLRVLLGCGKIIESKYEAFSALAQIKNAEGNSRFSFADIVQILETKTDVMQRIDLTKELSAMQVDGKYLLNPKEIGELLLVDEAFRNVDEVLAFKKQFPNIKEGLGKIAMSLAFTQKTGMKEFMLSDYMSKLKQNSAGKYQNELLDMFKPENMTSDFLSKLLQTDLSEADFLNSIKKMSKSTFKLAYETPHQYLSGIDIAHTTLVNGKLPELSAKELSNYREYITRFFKDNIGDIARVLKYVDTDTVSHMMDKRTSLFLEQIMGLNKLTDENYQLLSELLNLKIAGTNKKVSPKIKMQLCQIMQAFQSANLDTSILKECVQKGEIDITIPKKAIQTEMLKRAGVNTENIDVNKVKFNEEFSYRTLITRAENTASSAEMQLLKQQILTTANLCMTNVELREQMIREFESQISMLERAQQTDNPGYPLLKTFCDKLKNIEKTSSKELYGLFLKSLELAHGQNAISEELAEVIKISVENDFNKYIQDPSNKYGEVNARTKAQFEENGLNYEQWLKPDIKDIEIKVAGRKLTVKMWERNPQEDLFMGNKTTCCTGIGEPNGGATPTYLLSTCFNVVEMYDASGNVVAMSRIYMSNIDGKPALTMDNIEVNKPFKKGLSGDEVAQIRDGFFAYMNELAPKITGKEDTNVYFYSQDLQVPTGGLDIESKTTYFIGDIARDKVYVNAAKCSFINPKDLKNRGEIGWYVVPKETTRPTIKVTPENICEKLVELRKANGHDVETPEFKIFLESANKLLQTAKLNPSQLEFLDLCISKNIKITPNMTFILMNINEHNIEIINKVMSIDGTESEIDGSVTNIKANLTVPECETIFTTFKTKEDVQLALRLIEANSALLHPVEDSPLGPVTNLNEAYFSALTLKQNFNIYHQNPNLAESFIEAKRPLSDPSFKILSETKELSTEQIGYALKLDAIKNKEGVRVFYLGELTGELNASDTERASYSRHCVPLFEKMTEAEFNILSEIMSNTSQTDVVKIASLIRHCDTTIPEQAILLKELLVKNVKINNFKEFETFFKLSAEEKQVIIEKLNNNIELFELYPPTIKDINDDYIQKAKIMKDNPQIFGLRSRRRFVINNRTMDSFRDVTPEALNRAIDKTKLIPEKIAIKCTKLLKSAFDVAIDLERGLVDEKTFNSFIEATKKLETLKDEDIALLEPVFVEIFIRSRREHISLVPAKQMEFLLTEDISSYTQHQLSKILTSSDADFFTRKQKLNNLLTNHKDEILKILKNKCQNTCPEFIEIAEDLLNSPQGRTNLLFVSDLSVETLTVELFSVAKLISYVNNKPQDYINGHYSEKIIDIAKKERKFGEDANLRSTLSEDEIKQLDEITNTFKHSIDGRILDILDAVKATDIETVKLLLDKRIEVFRRELTELNYLSEEQKKVLSNIIRNGKRINKNGQPDKLTGQQKVDLINIIKSCSQVEQIYGTQFDYNKYMTPLQGKAFLFNIEELQKDIFKQILVKYGLSEAEIANLKSENLNWDMSRISLLTQKVRKDEGELATLVQEASKGRFKEFINDTSNPHGFANNETKIKFANAGLDYNTWQIGPEAQTIRIGGKEYTVKLWNRIPQESLFDGSYTTCCTSLDSANGGSMANYMLNTAINVVEVRDKSGKVVAMSRCYVAKIGDTQSLVIENIEANNALISEMTSAGTTESLVQGLHNYMKDFATEIGGEEMPVYMSTTFEKVSYPFREKFEVIKESVELTGNISKKEIYLNTYGTYVDANNLTNKAEFYIIRK